LIPGHITDEVVILGNHRDAWVYGASDPNSGTASVYEIVKGFGKLLEAGWKPLRSILIASWDGEEYGLLGSTEFGEDYAEWSKQVVAYLNVDGCESECFVKLMQLIPVSCSGIWLAIQRKSISFHG